jgi:hypothetical protein
MGRPEQIGNDDDDDDDDEDEEDFSKGIERCSRWVGPRLRPSRG